MRPSRVRLLVAIASLACIAVGVWQLERERDGLSIETVNAGDTPATVYRRAGGGPAPAVVIAHGFAGSRQLMETYSLTLARAGYLAVSFDFEGHGRNPTPMSGDVTRIDGTTQLLMAEIGRVTDLALAQPGVDGRVALLGHSMASDIIVRQAIADPRVAATVAISMFSEAVTPEEPRNLLIVPGEWEGTLREDALRNLRLADPSAGEDTTVGDPSEGTGRRVAVAPGVEHVGVLYSATALRETRDWLDAAFGRASAGPVSATGGAIAPLLLGIVALAWPLAGLLPRGETAPLPLEFKVFLAAVVAPAVATPLLLTLVDTRFLEVLVADYLAAHLLVYGVLSIGLLRGFGHGVGPVSWIAALGLAAYGIFVFGGALDRYVASFWPIDARLPIIAAVAAGAVPCMIGDGLVTEGGRARLWRVLAARGAFLASLGVAVVLDVERLFFLLMIIPVIILFFTIFGLMGGWVGRRTGSPVGAGLALGFLLAWAIGVSFPMYAPA